MTSESDVKTTLQTTKNTFGRLDVAVNCAGIGVAYLTYNKNKDKVHMQEDFTNVLMVCL